MSQARMAVGKTFFLKDAHPKPCRGHYKCFAEKIKRTFCQAVPLPVALNLNRSLVNFCCGSCQIDMAKGVTFPFE